MDALAQADEEYGAELARMSLKDVLEEPGRLKTARDALDERLQALSQVNYPVYISNHNCGKTVREQLTALQPHLSVVQRATTDIAASSRKFAGRATELCSTHDRITTTLQHHTQVRVRVCPRALPQLFPMLTAPPFLSLSPLAPRVAGSATARRNVCSQRLVRRGTGTVGVCVGVGGAARLER